MNESFALDDAVSLNVETSRLSSMAQWWDAGVLDGDRAIYTNSAALGVLLSGLIGGVAVLLLFLFALCKKKIDTRHLTVFKVSLVISGLLQSLSTPVVAMQLSGTICSVKDCYKLLMVWLASRRCGVFLHLLVTLEFIWKQWSEGAKIVPLYCSVPVVLILDLICLLFLEVIDAAVALGALAMGLILSLCISAWYTRKSMDKRLIQVFVMALISFVVTYFPSFVAECMLHQGKVVSGREFDILLCLTNLRLMADGFLYWATCRETEEVAQQTQTFPANAQTPQQAEAGGVELPYVR